MTVQLSDVEVIALMGMMETLPLSAFNTPMRKSILHKLLGNAPTVDISKCVGDGDGVMFALVNVKPGEIVTAVRVLRAATGWGLKEAKDAFDIADPHKMGGILGPFKSSVPTIDQLLANYANYEAKHGNIATDIHLVAVS